VGLPVRAVADGEVVRVKVKYRGLGRALYVRHAGGLMSVYGHLAGFAEPLRSWADGLIAERGRYPGDLFPPEPVAVKSGQVIAWSGKTGGGPPHLHFETRRDGGNRPVDPWAEGLPCPDDAPPRLLALAVVPSPTRWLHEPSRLVDLQAAPPAEPIPVAADARLAVRVVDELGAGTGSLRSLEARLDDELLVQVDLAAFTYDLGRFTGHLHARAAPAGPAADAGWIWLADLPGSRLPFVRGVVSPSELGARRATLSLVARDGCGNAARASLRLLVAPPSGGPAPTDDPAAATLVAWPPGTGVEGTHPVATRILATPVRGTGGPPPGEGPSLQLPAGALGEPAALGLWGAPGEAPPLPEGLVLHAYLRTGPAWLPIARKAVVRLRAPEGVARARLGIHRWNPVRDEWQFWGDDVADGGSIGTTTDRLGDFALVEDAFTPRLLSVDRRAIRGQPWRADGEELAVRYEERGEGIGWDGVRLRPDGVEAEWIGEHDPDLQEATFALPPGSAGAAVSGVLLLADGAGNVAELRISAAPLATR
jgi:hypothetical protein